MKGLERFLFTAIGKEGISVSKQEAEDLYKKLSDLYESKQTPCTSILKAELIGHYYDTKDVSGLKDSIKTLVSAIPTNQYEYFSQMATR